MENIYMLSDTEITKRISAKLKELRLKQNMSRQDMADCSGVSMSSIARMEEGEIKSFESLLRIMRTLGKMDVLLPLLEDQISPNEYYEIVHSARAKQRKRASRRNNNKNNAEEEPEW